MTSLRWVLVASIWMALFGSAVGVIWSKHQARMLFVELQRLEKQRDQLDVEWAQWRLQQSVDAAHDRIERVARNDLKMSAPQPRQVSLVRTAAPVGATESSP